MKVVEGEEYKICFVSWRSKLEPSEKEYAFVLVPVSKLEELNRKAESMEDYELEDFGVIVEKGLGQPNEAVLKRINNDFLTNFIPD